MNKTPKQVGFRLFLLLLTFPVWTSALGQEFNIVDHGAVADGTTLSTAAIQSAIDAAHEKGGGKVFVPSGQFLTGSIVLRSDVELHLEEGARLLGSTNPDHYRKLNRYLALVLADGQENIAITGKGEIDGQGRALALHIDSLFYAGQVDSSAYNFVELRPNYKVRPQLIELVKCSGITIRNVTLRNAAFWVLVPDKSEQLLIDSVQIISDAYWNNDGIDISDCKNVRITNCYVDTSDDGICLKSHADNWFCDSVYIADCTVRSSASAVKFGTLSRGGFRNITIKNIKVFDTFRSAIAIECVDAGTLENVLVDGIEATNTGNAIFIRLGRRTRFTRQTRPSVLRNVTIRNISVEVAFERPDYAYDIRGPSLPFFHNIFPSSITGIPGHRLENVKLENIEIKFPGRGNKGLKYAPLSRLDAIPEKVDAYPEYSMFGELPAWGFYVRHVDGLRMKNIRLILGEPDYRPALVFDDVHHLEVEGMVIEGDAKPVDAVIRQSSSVFLPEELVVSKLK